MATFFDKFSISHFYVVFAVAAFVLSSKGKLLKFLSQGVFTFLPLTHLFIVFACQTQKKENMRIIIFMISDNAKF